MKISFKSQQSEICWSEWYERLDVLKRRLLCFFSKFIEIGNLMFQCMDNEKSESHLNKRLEKRLFSFKFAYHGSRWIVIFQL